MSHKFNPYKDYHHHKHHKQPKHNTLPDYNTSRPLGKPTYKVEYFINNDDIVNVNEFVFDTQVYAEGETVLIKSYETKHFSIDGTKEYSFIGWTRSPNARYIIDVPEGSELTIHSSDIKLYAQWEEVSTLHMTADNGVSLKREYVLSLPNLNIPEYLQGRRVKKIVSPGFAFARASSITIPASVVEIEAEAFDNWKGHSIYFADAEITDKYPGLTLGEEVFSNTPNLTNILLPYRLVSFTSPVFPGENKVLNIYVRHTKQYMSVATGIPIADIDDALAGSNDTPKGYVRHIEWGYNE